MKYEPKCIILLEKYANEFQRLLHMTKIIRVAKTRIKLCFKIQDLDKLKDRLYTFMRNDLLSDEKYMKDTNQIKN